MRKIQGKERTVRELLGHKYTIDYYQRDYKWETKQIHELIEDLTNAFFDYYRTDQQRREVKNYGRYFVGSIIISEKDNTNYIVDGQQRLTSLTLLLIFLNNLQQRIESDKVNIDDLIFSEQYGERSFNLVVEERADAMNELFSGSMPDQTEHSSESVRNIIGRYQDIEEYFPQEIDHSSLPFFIDWLIENVDLVQITAYSDDDAYTIFETMNDRGLSLSPVEMLKGFLLTNITDTDKRTRANELWKQRTQSLREVGREDDFFKSWLRSQYAMTIRGKAKGVTPGDFERIGSEFHRWVRQHADESGADELVLVKSDDYLEFIQRDFDFYSNHYKRLTDASSDMDEGLEHVFYNARQGFTLQPMMLLAPLDPADSDDTAKSKQRLVAIYIDIVLTRRIWNYRTISQSSMHDSMFRVMREIRRQGPREVAERLHRQLANDDLSFASNDTLRLHQQNRYRLHQILARIADYVEVQSGNPSRFLEYVAETGKNRYEIEHIWADKPERHVDQFGSAAEFHEYRNRFGGLLLLPKSFNASYGALPYEDKLKHYNTQGSLLARSLHPQAYDHNPGFLRFIDRTGLPFRPHESFMREDLAERQLLYRRIAERIWNPDLLLNEVGCASDAV